MNPTTHNPPPKRYHGKGGFNPSVPGRTVVKSIDEAERLARIEKKLDILLAYCGRTASSMDGAVADAAYRLDCDLRREGLRR